MEQQQQQQTSKFQNIYDILDGEDHQEQERVYQSSKRIMKTLILLIVLTIIAAVAIPIVMIAVHVRADDSKRSTAYFKELYGEGELVEPIEKTLGTPFFVNEKETMQITVNSVSELQNINHTELIPEGEKIIAISLTEVLPTSMVLHLKDCTIEDPYIGYGPFFKETFRNYYLKDVLEMEVTSNAFAEEDVAFLPTNTGYAYALVPQDVQECCVYISIKDMESKHVTHIYKVPVTIEQEVAADEN